MQNTKLKHPLESLFNLPENENLNPLAEKKEDDYLAVQQAATESEYKDDEEDIDINNKIEDIYTTAIETFEQQTAYAEITEPRYAARNAEVAAQYLNIALSAVALKSKNKVDKRKTKNAFIPFNNTNISGSNIVVAGRNQLLEMMEKEFEN